ncbi:MAG: hypothetical protein ACW986_18215 [Promethearchaeota archaeon]|jgi:hypothetical protein
MSELQETDKTMRAVAMLGGIIAFIESILAVSGTGLMDWGIASDLVNGILGIIFAVIVIALGIKPIRYTPVFLGILGILLIVFGILIGGIFVLLGTFIGAIS